LKEMVKRPINNSASFPARETVARCSDRWTSLGVSLFFQCLNYFAFMFLFHNFERSLFCDEFKIVLSVFFQRKCTRIPNYDGAENEKGISGEDLQASFWIQGLRFNISSRSDSTAILKFMIEKILRKE
jgi:hypothetical protein